jgi:hypothetical protein
MTEMPADSVVDDTRPQALEYLHEFSAQIPQASAPRRLALGIAKGNTQAFLTTQSG